MNREKAVTVLNSLIEINNDRMEGYKTASKETEEKDLRNLFSEFMQTSKTCKAQLVTEVHNMGGNPIVGTKTSGKFFRVLMDVKVALTGHDRNTIISSCVEGEDVALETYDQTLRNNLGDINSDQHAIISAQHSIIRADHDKLKSMRDMVLEHN